MWAIITALFWTACIGSVSAEEIGKLDKQLTTWRAAKAKADERLLKEFDRAKAGILRDRSIPVETRNRHVSALQNQKTLFEKSRQLPESDQMLPAIIDYLDDLHKVSTSIRTQFDQALNQSVGTGATYDAIAAAKEKWQSELPGRDELAALAAFHGTRTFLGGKTVEFHLHVIQFENESFSGHIWQDAPNAVGRTGWEYEAIREGNQFLVTTTKMIQGEARTVKFRGYIIGRRIVMTLTHINGKPVEPGDIASIWKK